MFTAVLCVRQAHPTTNRTTTEIGQRPIGPDHRLSSKSRTRRRISRPDCLLWRSGRRGFFMRTGRPLCAHRQTPPTKNARPDQPTGQPGRARWCQWVGFRGQPPSRGQMHRDEQLAAIPLGEPPDLQIPVEAKPQSGAASETLPRTAWPEMLLLC